MSSQHMPFSEESLSIIGYQSRAVANTFFRQNLSTDHLAIILPGAGYIARMPILYYTVSLFLEHKADILTVDYDYRSLAKHSKAEIKETLLTDVISAIQVALQQRPYQRVTIIGKSLGTRILSWILSDKNHPFTHISDFRTVWLTPVWKDNEVFPIMQGLRHPALHVIGTADHYYYAERHRQILESNHTKVLAIANANHSLDIEGDIKGSLDAVGSTVDAIREFVSNHA